MMIVYKNQNKKYDDKVYSNFCGLNVPENDIQIGSFTIISIDASVVYEKSVTYDYF